MFETVADVATFLLGVAGISSLVFVGVRQGQILAMKSTMQAQADAIDALQAEVATQKGRLERYGVKLEEARVERDFAKSVVKALVEETAAAGVCVRAPGCPDRIAPAAAGGERAA